MHIYNKFLVISSKNFYRNTKSVRGGGGGERAVERMSKTKESLALLGIIGLCAAISVLAQPTPTTPFVIHGYVFL